MRNRIRFYVPSRDCYGNRIAYRKPLQKVIRAFTEFFGGCTRFEGHGSYLASTGKIITERVNIVESFCDDRKLREHLQSIRSLAAEICVTLNQETIAIVVNDQMEFIKR